MINSQTIRTAIVLYLQSAGINKADLARKLEITHKTVRLWLSGETEEISNDNWKVLFPLIKPYLPIDRIYKTLTGEEIYLDDEAYIEKKKLNNNAMPPVKNGNSCDDIESIITKIKDEIRKGAAEKHYHNSLKILKSEIESML